MERWPDLVFDDARETLVTLHLWAQIVGKVRLRLSPWINHSWHATLHVTHRGLTSTPIHHGGRMLELELDLVDHVLRVEVAGGPSRGLALRPRTVASLYHELMATLDDLGLGVRIHGAPNELPEAIPFARDTVHATYEPEQATRFWRALVHAHRVFTWFRAGYRGKCSPVHLFWGSLDLAVTRFSGRPAPPHPGGIPHLPDRVTREAYSHEVSSAGFWAGSESSVPYAAFYSYAYPSPEGFAAARIEPAEASWHAGLGEFVLPYAAVRAARDPDALLARFLESTWAAAADLGGWDRAALECGRAPPS